MEFKDIFPYKPIIGMIHLAGKNYEDRVKRALDELTIFQEEGLDGAIVENYHGNIPDVARTLEESSKMNFKIKIGVNVLPKEFDKSFLLAYENGARFIQLDYVSGKYDRGELNYELYKEFKEEYPNIAVLGGVWPKYYHPVENSNLEADLKEGMQRAEAIVVTGEGTGKETSIEKIRYFRKILNEHPLIIGAGLNPKNAYEQISICDGAIVGSYLKINGKTENDLDKTRIRELMDIIKETREK